MKAMKVVDLKISCKAREHSPDTGICFSIFLAANSFDNNNTCYTVMEYNGMLNFEEKKKV